MIEEADQQKMINYFEKLSKNYLTYRKRHSYYWKSITRYIDYFLHNENSILEIGCGIGDLLANVKGNKKTGVDFSDGMIKIAKEQYPDIDFHVMRAENLELTGKYDVIVLSNLIGYLDDIEHVFRQLKKVSHDRTRIIVTYYNKFWEPFIRFAEVIGIKRKTPQQNWLTNTDIINLLYLAGFECYRNNRSMLIPYNIPLLSTFLNKFISRLPFFNQMALNRYVFARPFQHLLDKSELDKKHSTTVVIPARNESGNIENAILRMPKFGKHTEIIFIEGNSTDDTWNKIQEIQKKYDGEHDIKIGQQSGKGKGDAVRKGFDMATGDILMILDADLTVPPEDIQKFYYAISSGKGEFINGSRLIYPMDKNAMRTLNTFGNKFFSKAFTWLLEQPVKDTLCGTKVLFREDYIRLINNRKFFGEFDPFGDFDLIFGAYKLNLKIIDLPIRYRERKYGDTNISRFSHGFLLMRMVAYAARKIKFY